MSEEDAVEAVIRSWHKAISSGDIAGLKGLWDQAYGRLLFIAEENNDALTDWPSISAYYDALGTLQINWTIDGLKVGVAGDGAWAYLTFVAAGRVDALKHDFIWNGRSSFFLRKDAGVWKIVHYHESLSRDHSHEAWGWSFESA